ncbi:transposase, partial [Limosilactobacillus fermentum]
AAKQSYTGRSVCTVIAKRRMKLPKLGSIRTSKTSQAVNGKIKRYTVSYGPTGRYYLSLQVETVAPEALPKTGKTVGLDVGIADLAISSDGEKFGTFNAKWLEKQATKWQSKYSRRKYQATVAVRQWNHNHKDVKMDLNDYQNWQRAQKQKARYQQRIANQRQDYLHKLTTALVKKYDVI